MILTAFISFGLWVHHMFTVGIPHVAQAFFSIASMLVAIPTAIRVFAWLATLWLGRVHFELLMLWVFGFLVIFVCGGLIGVMLALVPFNWQVHDTHFVVAHFHYVLVGGHALPLDRRPLLLAAAHGGAYASCNHGTLCFLADIYRLQYNLPADAPDPPVGYAAPGYTYEAGVGWDWLNLVSSIGGFIMAMGVAVTFLDLLLHRRFGRKATQSPWHADTLEWATPFPPPPYNFASLSHIHSRHPPGRNPTCR